ncbi:Assimilatory nitrite reductase (NAD(P)H) small subunit [Sterolibacterium denitrificans]|uniref:Assimilatory nitrite reductase (NAD(P)H) small subunit n=1 Tax=Sterolibacterium denitrificans TaxID=157592 RepID=A0A7Z7HSI8_9PROT|nr:nitrite reductase small subunit NirD [Sterolibacterium denitrificans]SMB28374.1 Assimilatory nitrite reductase (NAD(P)H) small subunit [Sterolibacterium denitrificans]
MKEWKLVCALDEIPRLGSRVVKTSGPDIAVFRTAEDEVFAMHDRCPHKGGPLSQGIVHGRRVTCPLHGMNIGLTDGQAVAPDVGQVPCIAVRIDAGRVYLEL